MPLSDSIDIKELNNSDIANIAKQLLIAILTMQKFEITLKNLKPSNIFMNEFDLIPKITNAGFSCLYDQTKKPIKIEAEDEFWMAPEVRGAKNNTQADTWSVGAIIFWLFHKTKLKNTKS